MTAVRASELARRTAAIPQSRHPRPRSGMSGLRRHRSINCSAFRSSESVRSVFHSFAKCKLTPGRQRTPSCSWLTSGGHLTRSGCACSIGLGELSQFPALSALTRHRCSSRGLAAGFGADAACAERTNVKPDASAEEGLKINHQGATGVVARAAASNPLRIKCMIITFIR
jgi:hypothetical protein